MEAEKVEPGNGLVKVNGLTLTKNRKGVELTTASPLFEQWIEAYDGVHPIVDIGAAYGMNVGQALAKGIRVVALDCDHRHLDEIKRKFAKEIETGQLKVGFARLPDEFPKELDGPFSSVLLSEVVHFLHGWEIEKSLEWLHRKMVPGAHIAINAASGDLHFWDMDEEYFQSWHAKFAKREAAGERWPGDDEGLFITANAIRDPSKHPMQPALFEILHCQSVRALAGAVERAGFKAVLATTGTHPGYIPNPKTVGEPGVFVVGKK